LWTLHTNPKYRTPENFREETRSQSAAGVGISTNTDCGFHPEGFPLGIRCSNTQYLLEFFFLETDLRQACESDSHCLVGGWCHTDHIRFDSFWHYQCQIPNTTQCLRMELLPCSFGSDSHHSLKHSARGILLLQDFSQQVRLPGEVIARWLSSGMYLVAACYAR